MTDKSLPYRRQSDLIMGALADRMDSSDRTVERVSDALEKHLAECSAMQKRVLGIACLILGWIVAHSPEASGIAKALFKVGTP